MGAQKRPARVKLVIGMLAKDKKLFDCTEEFFVKEFGQIDYRSPCLLFNYTDYYKEEMGHPLKRRFISFEKLIPPQDLPKIKLKTNLIEKKTSQNKKRLINVDPGYINDSKFILATTKDYFHRIYLGKGMYAEVTLYWKKDGFQTFDWTYPDYRTKEYRDILNKIREAYAKERKTFHNQGG